MNAGEAIAKERVQRESRWLRPGSEDRGEGLRRERSCGGGRRRTEGPGPEDEVLSRGWCSLTFSKGTCRASAQAQRERGSWD